jgi:hypothetical protein
MKHYMKLANNDNLRIEVIIDMLIDNMTLNGQMKTRRINDNLIPTEWETFCKTTINLNDISGDVNLDNIITDFYSTMKAKYSVYSVLNDTLKSMKVIEIPENNYEK